MCMWPNECVFGCFVLAYCVFVGVYSTLYCQIIICLVIIGFDVRDVLYFFVTAYIFPRGFRVGDISNSDEGGTEDIRPYIRGGWVGVSETNDVVVTSSL